MATKCTKDPLGVKKTVLKYISSTIKKFESGLHIKQ